MKKLEGLIQGINVISILGRSNVKIASITCTLNQVTSSSLFISTDNVKIYQAIAEGSIAIICEQFPPNFLNSITFVKVKSVRHATGIIAHNFYDRPSTKLRLVAVTGTNGKSSTVNFLHEIMRKLRLKTGMFSTVRHKINDVAFVANPLALEATTTPDAITLNAFLAKMVDARCIYCFLEASSQSLAEGYLVGLKLSGAVFTNLSLDHLDYHRTYDTYREAKKSLFDALDEKAFAIGNLDDVETQYMFKDTKASKFYFSLKSHTDFLGKIVESSFYHLKLQINGEEIFVGISGKYNAYNLLATYAVVSCLQDFPIDRAFLENFRALSCTDGRFYVYSTHNFKIIVDHAHTPEALKAALKSTNDMKAEHSRTILVFGCGGNQDRRKRPLMGRIGVEQSDIAIFTTDNPRFECPDVIINEMMSGLPLPLPESVLRIVDRRSAIESALGMVKRGDILLVAGRGHEPFQIVQGKQESFKDIQVVRELISEMD